MIIKYSFLTAAATAAVITTQAVGFTDTFDSIDPAWVTDRAEPGAFVVENFDGDNRLRIDIDDADFRSSGIPNFYNTQGRKRDVSIGDTWSLSGDVYISPEMLAGGNYRTDLWARSAANQYPIFGVARFNDTHPDYVAGGALNWHVWDSDSGWEVLGPVASSGWHNLEVIGGPGSFAFYLDGVLVHEDVTTLPPEAITTAFVQAYNFGEDYSVYWDNISASAVPEAGTTLALLSVGAMALAGFKPRKK